MELQHVKDLPKRLRLMSAHSKWHFEDPNNCTILKTDIKNQFTNLNKNEVLDALHFILNRATTIMRKSFAIRRREKEKRSDKAGTARTRDYWNIPFSAVLRYTMFELETPYFKIGDRFYLQTNGLPMGGFLSAALAVIFSMVREKKNQSLWRHLCFPSKSLRFRDDVFTLIKGQITPEYAESIRANLQQLYGPSLEVELKELTQHHACFLEYWIMATPDGLTSWHYNKNHDLLFGSTPKAIVRYPDTSADLPLIHFKAIVHGLIHKTFKCATTFPGIVIGIIQACQELLKKRYPIKWILHAIHRSKHPHADLLALVVRITYHALGEVFGANQKNQLINPPAVSTKFSIKETNFRHQK